MRHSPFSCVGSLRRSEGAEYRAQDSTMKVLHVIPSVSRVHGGPSYALAMMERALTARGIEVTTATTDDDGAGRRLPTTEQPVYANGAGRYYAAKRTEFYKVSPALGGWLMRNTSAFDIIHIHALFSFSSAAAAFAARRHRVPYVVRPLGTLNSYGIEQRRPLLKQLSFRHIERRLLTHAAAVHFTSQEEWDEAKVLGIPLSGAVIPLGVIGPEPGDAADPPFVTWPGEKVVLFLSRLDPKKNVEGLIRAFAKVRSRHPHVRLVIAGDGAADYVSSLRALGASEGMGYSIHWTGHIEGRAKWGALKAADVFTLPSFSENFGIAAVEAMIAGLPCVVGRGVALAEAIDTAGAGLVTEPEPSAIAIALDRLLGDERMRAEMGTRAHALASQRFSADAMAARLVELYTRIVEDTGRMVPPTPAADPDRSRSSCTTTRSAAQP